MKRVVAVAIIILLSEILVVALVIARSGFVEGAMVSASLFLVTAFGSAPLILRAMSNRR